MSVEFGARRRGGRGSPSLRRAPEDLEDGRAPAGLMLVAAGIAGAGTLALLALALSASLAAVAVMALLGILAGTGLAYALRSSRHAGA